MSIQMGNTIDNFGNFPRPGTRLGQSGGVQPLDPRPAAPKASGSADSQQGNDQAHVRFSDSVALLQRVQSRLDATPVVDSERVSATRAAISSGSYAIDYGEIANKLLQADKELP